jgi:hypothetical protein
MVIDRETFGRDAFRGRAPLVAARGSLLNRLFFIAVSLQLSCQKTPISACVTEGEAYGDTQQRPRRQTLKSPPHQRVKITSFIKRLRLVLPAYPVSCSVVSPNFPQSALRACSKSSARLDGSGIHLLGSSR